MIPTSNGELQGERYSRLRLIPWWDQSKIMACKVLVIGAGALGNEILKNLALLGFSEVAVVDMDRIDESNLSRAILYRSSDVGEFKVDVAARSYKAISQNAVVQPIKANVTRECGLGLFLWSDVIIAGLDNREARLWINRCAWKVNRPWIDGAIEGINGVARVFLPGIAPCYECTLGEVDWAILERRMSCNLLAHEEVKEGKIPTTPTIASIIGGIQVQEAVKLIHGAATLAGKGFVFEGLNHTSYRVAYSENPDCMSHDALPEIVKLRKRSNEINLQQLWQLAKKDLNANEVTIEFSRDVIQELACPHCGKKEELFAPVGSVTYQAGSCPDDGHRRAVVAVHSYSGAEAFGHRKLNELGLPLFDIYLARSAVGEIGYLIEGDAAAVLGALGKDRV
jgi:molybdopterin/thiamine biosynthesis adenylyltransferase